MDRYYKLRRITKVLCRENRKNSTYAEKIMWEAVRNRKLNGKKINRQFPIFYTLNGKQKFFIADFYCHKKKLVIEIDGEYHKRQIEYDKHRTEIINNLGIKILRFRNEEVEKELTKTINKIKENL